ncbi:hypothetical protein FGK63_16225 [Ruegeria sediminis]|uniref:Roadblock/LC7 domain-containing protein n=1 Tax=Ruegeria sediminis TaxID=2583820 RepID=A0ABY2WV70_9RHOB|nr:hypothetical protein [Ruegeria sediminis]TMV05590.1 hypothetical protein FGK63_16225 [Ruegeria sediminis]
MSIETALKSAMETIPDCFAAGYIDMGTGMLLSVQGEDPDSAEALENLAVAVSNLFQGKGVRAFEDMLRDAGVQDPDAPGFGEIAVFSGGRLHVFLRTAKYPDHVICYICRDSANVGLALTKSHLSLGPVAAAV